MTRTNQCESLITFQCQEKHWYCEEPEEPEVVLLPVMRSMEISSALSAQIVRNTKTELMSLVHTDCLHGWHVSPSTLPGLVFYL